MAASVIGTSAKDWTESHVLPLNQLRKNIHLHRLKIWGHSPNVVSCEVVGSRRESFAIVRQEQKSTVGCTADTNQLSNYLQILSDNNSPMTETTVAKVDFVPDHHASRRLFTNT